MNACDNPACQYHTAHTDTPNKTFVRVRPKMAGCGQPAIVACTLCEDCFNSGYIPRPNYLTTVVPL